MPPEQRNTKHGLPAPGAIGIFGAGTGGHGDSAYFGAIGMRQRPSLPLLGGVACASLGYFSNAGDADPLVNPSIAPVSFRAQFPPTLLVTATRAFDMSAAIATRGLRGNVGLPLGCIRNDGCGHDFVHNTQSE